LRPSIAVALLVAALGLFPSAHALAQDAHDAAVAAFHEGEAAFGEDDYVLALEHFRHAFELAPHDAVRFNIGVCLERLGRFREATLEYDAASASTELDAEGRARAVDLAQRTRARLGTLIITATEIARAEVAGLTCETPCRLELDPGAYDVVARGTNERTAHVDITRGSEAHAALDTLHAQTTAPVDTTEHHGWTSFGALLGVGIALAVVGAAGIIGFGLAADDAHTRYFGGMATASLAQEGALDRDLANASIGVLGAGALFVLVDLVLLAADPARSTMANRGALLRF
jgi:tetratricopeptide (TPR) repeat protein